MSARPFVTVDWVCRGCGCLIQEQHAPDCRFAPLPGKVCESREGHNAHGWETPDGKRVFCPGFFA